MFEKSYLLREGHDLTERLQFLFMRVSIGIHGDHLDDILATYHLLSTRKISFASPILWNAGLSTRHFASCYAFEPFSAHSNDAVFSFSSLSALWSADGGIGISAGDVPATTYVFSVLMARRHKFTPFKQHSREQLSPRSHAITPSVRVNGKFLVSVKPT